MTPILIILIQRGRSGTTWRGAGGEQQAPRVQGDRVDENHNRTPSVFLTLQWTWICNQRNGGEPDPD